MSNTLLCLCRLGADGRISYGYVRRDEASQYPTVYSTNSLHRSTSFVGIAETYEEAYAAANTRKEDWERIEKERTDSEIPSERSRQERILTDTPPASHFSYELPESQSGRQ